MNPATQPAAAADELQPVSRAHYNSALWAVQRNSAFGRWGRFCNCCGETKDLVVHHLVYRKVDECTDDDLMPLCEPCHETFHAVGNPPYSLTEIGDHFDKRRLTIRRVLRYRFNALQRTPSETVILLRDRWKLIQAIKRRPAWRYVEYAKIPTATLAAAAADDKFAEDPEWLYPGWAPHTKAAAR